MTMFGRFSPAARSAVLRAADLAATAARPRIGTEFLLLALCEDAHVRPALHRQGVTRARVQAAITEALGAPRPYEEGELLAALGIDLAEVRRRARAVAPGPGRAWELRRSPLWPLRVAVTGPGRDLPFTGGGRKVLEVALWRGRRDGRVPAGPGDLLHGILADSHSNAARVLRHLGARPCALVAALEHPDAA
ncbi:hypothetical protein DPM19_17880 [Actinomadura craniellae]|uniref:Clp R domain-containing protein n=1 Tax=Actinomadura craniellae TaxID=2231787 RepID=A0A365H4V6_9ACTN|nr:Clp protease N-terminal domain-containing protein [Actinomadura craniellae]RAY14140.1 hypothetical protein DPM19_17880 [Actinomadura craniellae]